MPRRATRPATVSPRRTRSWFVKRCGRGGLGRGASSGRATSTVTVERSIVSATVPGAMPNAVTTPSAGSPSSSGAEGQLPDRQEPGEALR